VARLLDAFVSKYDKLVRDRIPEIVEQAGKRAITRTVEGAELDSALRAKLIEEAHEVADAEDRDALVAELADLAEVLDATLHFHGIAAREVAERRAKRNAERGAFEQGLLLERVDET
jgi:predicted house-cleaning noncanonical NTP pyrophosphatase (MazG superfamily)